MSKGTRKVMGALFGAVLALVLAVCILCATFARYTTSSTGDSGAVSVELWDVRATGVENVEVDTTDLRPDYETTYSDSTGARSRTTETPIPLLTFENLGSLDADVTMKCVTGGDGTTAEVTLNWDENFAGWGEGWTEDDGTNAYMKTIMAGVDEIMAALNYSDADGKDAFNKLVNKGMSGKGLFSVEFGTMSNGTFTSFDDEDNDNSFSLKAEGQEQVTVYAMITWTSHYGVGSGGSYALTAEEVSDAIDTIIGMYVESIGFTIEWEAVQASQTGLSNSTP